MKTPDNLVIIYDDRCPICTAYTRIFVKLKMLRAENRVSFSELGNQPWLKQIDFSKSRNEIPLVDTATGRTRYGIQALLFILSFRIPLLTRIAGAQPFRFLLEKFYALISFNRRIIVGDMPEKKTNQPIECDCTPTFHPLYRTLFILICEAFACWISFLFGKNIGEAWGWNPDGAGIAALLICGTGWVLMMTGAVAMVNENRKMDYLGHLALMQFTGVMPLIPSLFIDEKTPVTIAAVAGVMLSAWWMEKEHRRRSHIFAKPLHAHFTWIAVMAATALFWSAFFIHR